MKKQSNFRLSDEARSLLSQIALSLGIDQTAALEVLIREAAKKRLK